MTDLSEVFGEPISVYTADDAVEDGVLVEAAPDQYGGSVLVTRAVFDAVWPESIAEGDTHPDGRTYLQRMIPLLMDALLLTRQAQRNLRRRGQIITKGLEGNVTGQDVWIAGNDRGGITLLFPSDN